MARQIQVSEAAAARRRVYFHCVDVIDGITPEVGEAGGQPETSIDGAAWVGAASIGVLVAIGNGRYYAEVVVATVDTVGRLIETRYKSAATAESVGDSLEVVAHNPSTSIDAIETDAALVLVDTTAILVDTTAILVDTAAMIATLALQDTELGKILGAVAGKCFVNVAGTQIKFYTFAGALLSTLDWNPGTTTWDVTW